MTDARWRFVPLPAPHAFRVESPSGGSPGELHGLEADGFIAWVRELEEEANRGDPTQDEIEALCNGSCSVVDELDAEIDAVNKRMRRLLTNLRRLLLRAKSLDELKRGMIQRLEEED